MAAQIESTFGINPTLIVGQGGCFEVVVDDQLLFSKNDAGRFPETSEVLAALKNLAEG